jgi:uncharacterized protein (DUF3820 family)
MQFSAQTAGMQVARMEGNLWRSVTDGRPLAREEGGHITLLFGQYRGRCLHEVPAEYLAWLGQAAHMVPEDLRGLCVIALGQRLPAEVLEDFQARLGRGEPLTINEIAAAVPVVEVAVQVQAADGEVDPPGPGEPGAWAWVDDTP